jgi:hypothetical protein
MTTTVKTFVRPEGTVEFKAIHLDIKTNKFTMVLGFKAKGKRKFDYEPISGRFGGELRDYFTKLVPETVQVEQTTPEGPKIVRVPTGKMYTPFQKYLSKRGIEFVPNILSHMVFTADNFSENYSEFPFKLIRYKDNNSLTLVNTGTKKKVSSMDPTTGVTTDKYFTRTFEYNGKVQKEYFPPKYYTRLIVETVKEVEVYQEA